VVALMLFAALAWWLDRAFVELRPLDQRELLGPAARPGS